MSTDRVKIAYEIATLLIDQGCDGAEGITILSIAMGIYLEAQKVTHREFQPLADVVCKYAQDVFDHLRAGRLNRGHA